MGNIEITKKISWDMGHRLGDGYSSKCRHCHGHRYTAEITFTSPELDEYGMVLDFGDINSICKGWIDDNIDHAFLVGRRDESLIKFLEQEKNRYHVVPFNTTVENITPWLAERLQEQLDLSGKFTGRDVALTRLRVYETPNGWAEWQKPTL